MTRRRPPRLALALLERLVADSEPLAGDLVEAFEGHPSALWFWWQAAAAVAASWFGRDVEIRPLHLVDLQPADALERSRRLSLRFHPVNLTASPVSGMGGLGLVILCGLLTIFMPAMWWLLLGSVLAGAGLAAVVIAMRDPVSH